MNKEGTFKVSPIWTHCLYFSGWSIFSAEKYFQLKIFNLVFCFGVSSFWGIALSRNCGAGKGNVGMWKKIFFSRNFYDL